MVLLIKIIEKQKCKAYTDTHCLEAQFLYSVFAETAN
jgi:hypothetical protein